MHCKDTWHAALQLGIGNGLVPEGRENENEKEEEKEKEEESIVSGLVSEGREKRKRKYYGNIIIDDFLYIIF